MSEEEMLTKEQIDACNAACQPLLNKMKGALEGEPIFMGLAVTVSMVRSILGHLKGIEADKIGTYTLEYLSHQAAFGVNHMLKMQKMDGGE